MGFQEPDGIFLILELGAGFGIFDDDTGGCVFQPDACFDLVDVLASRTAGAEGVPGDVGWVDLDINGVVDQRGDED